MKRIDQIIGLVRERTRNVDYSVNSSTGVVESGVSTDLILQFINEAQDHLQAAILGVFPNDFIEEKTISIVGRQEAYSIPDRVFNVSKIVSVEYRQNSNSEDYLPLDLRTFRERDTSYGDPLFYIRQKGQILLNPIPSTSQGALRVMYYRELDDLDIRRGTVSARTLSSTQLTSLTIDSTTDDALALGAADYLCVNDRYGDVKMYNIPMSAYDSATGSVTLIGGGFTFASGETVDVGDYVTVGKYTTTHSKLQDNSERFLILYAQKRLLSVDNDNSAVLEDAELQAVKGDILNSYADESRDVETIPIIDYEILI